MTDLQFHLNLYLLLKPDFNPHNAAGEAPTVPVRIPIKRVTT